MSPQIVTFPQTPVSSVTHRALCLLEYCPKKENLPDFFANKAGVLLEGGNGLFVGNAKGYIRLNLAMPRATVQTRLERIAAAIHAQQAEA